MDDDPPSPVHHDLPHQQTSELTWPLDGADGLRDELAAAYAAPARAHHGTRHLAEVLERLDELAAAGTAYDRTPVLLAAWFHDAVYDGERDAEERSACWAEDALPGLVDEACVAEVARLVRLTEHHRPEPDDLNGCALSDADLAILAAPPERYALYSAGVRIEYAHLHDDVFVDGRADVLRDLTEAASLFRTEHGRAAWEAPARANVARELADLEQRIVRRRSAG